MAERRGSMYDPARDIFTNSDDAPEEAPAEAVVSSPAVSDKKRSPSPEQNGNGPIKSKLPAETSGAKRSSLDETEDPPAKRARTSTSPAPKAAPAAPSEPQKAKPMTAANLAALPRAKKAPGQRAQPPPRRRDDLQPQRRRSRSPRQRSPDSRRRDRATPPRRRTPSPPPIARSPSRSPPRQRKRPGAASRVNNSDIEAVRRRQQERERAQDRDAHADAVKRGVHDVVRQHYNTVPQYGREWRKESSMIKGLRSFNNWVKSAVIQKFSPNEDYTPGARAQGRSGSNEGQDGLRVLDIGCGKGGDLQKWQNAPQWVEVYVGLDPADKSIEQARDRYQGMPKVGRGEFRGRPLYHSEFHVKDCFGEFLGDIPIIRQIGIDPSGGPMAHGGFDVVSMMFCMHYAFESEEKARGMLKNVSAALKKGGRFLGVIPNSDVLSAKVNDFNKKGKQDGTTPATKPTNENSLGNTLAKGEDAEDGEIEDDWDPEKPSNPQLQADEAPKGDDDDDEWDPEKPSDPHTTTTAAQQDDDDWNPEKPSAPDGVTTDTGAAATATETNEATASTPETRNGLEWGNAIYRIKFPGKVPVDGVFRPSYGWKYFFFLEEAVDEVPEYVVPWEAFRAMAVDYDLELQYRKPFPEVWAEEKNDRKLGELSERMGVRSRNSGELMVSAEEMEAAGFYHAFCFYKT